jgi:hypothetical protein
MVNLHNNTNKEYKNTRIQEYNSKDDALELLILKTWYDIKSLGREIQDLDCASLRAQVVYDRQLRGPIRSHCATSIGV